MPHDETGREVEVARSCGVWLPVASDVAVGDRRTQNTVTMTAIGDDLVEAAFVVLLGERALARGWTPSANQSENVAATMKI